MNKNLENPSVDVFALHAFVLLSWLCACEQAHATALTASRVASQLKTSPEEKPEKPFSYDNINYNENC